MTTRTRPLRLLAVAALGASTAPALMAQVPSFTGLGHRPEELFDNAAYGVSGDGRTVVGYFTPPEGLTAFRWTADEGLVSLGFIVDGDINSLARAASSDGSFIAGDGAKLRGHDAFRWDPVNGMMSLGNLAHRPRFFGNSVAYAISSDGSVVVGVSDNTSGNGEAFRWTESGGMVGLGDLPGGPFLSVAHGVPGDGQVVVGLSENDQGRVAFRWTQADGMVSLGDFPGGIEASDALDASADGSVVVGWGTTDSFSSDPDDPIASHAFRWTAASGLYDLGDLPGGRFYSLANSVSDDGEVIVGQATGFLTPDNPSGLQAFIWTRWTGMRSLHDVLTSRGVALPGWFLTSATGVSADGRTIVGFGVHGDLGEAWTATLPRICPGDFNASGAVSVQDIFDFLGAYFANDPRTDVNLSGSVSVQDIFDFLAGYFTAC